MDHIKQTNLVSQLKRHRQDMQDRHDALSGRTNPTKHPLKTGLEHLVPKRITGPLSEQDRQDLTEAQNVGLDLAAQRVAMEKDRAAKNLERLQQLETLIRAAIQRGDIILAKRLAQKAGSLNTAIQASVKKASNTYTTAPTGDVARTIQDLKAIGNKAARVMQKIDAMTNKTSREEPASGPSLADLHPLGSRHARTSATPHALGYKQIDA